MEKIRVGLIGCGRISGLHYQGYIDSKAAEVYAVCDTDQELAKARQKEWRAEKCFFDYQKCCTIYKLFTAVYLKQSKSILNYLKI